MQAHHKESSSQKSTFLNNDQWCSKTVGAQDLHRVISKFNKPLVMIIKRDKNP